MMAISSTTPVHAAGFWRKERGWGSWTRRKVDMGRRAEKDLVAAWVMESSLALARVEGQGGQVYH